MNPEVPTARDYLKSHFRLINLVQGMPAPDRDGVQ
jgi:hypothetical protein